MSSRFSPSTNLSKLCFGSRLSTAKIKSLDGQNKFCQRWKSLLRGNELFIHVRAWPESIIDIKKTNDRRAVGSLQGVWLAVEYISNQWLGWAGKSNLLMGLMECEMLKERQPLAVCPLHLEPLILSSRLKLQRGDSNSGLISSCSWYSGVLNSKQLLLESHAVVWDFTRICHLIIALITLCSWKKLIGRFPVALPF